MKSALSYCLGTRTHTLCSNSTEGWHRNGIIQRLIFSVAFVSDLCNRDAFNWRSCREHRANAVTAWKLVNSSGNVYNIPFLVRLFPQSLHTILMPLTNQHCSLCSEYLTSRSVPRSYRSSIGYCSYVLYPWQLFSFMLKKKKKSTHSQQLLDTAFGVKFLRCNSLERSTTNRYSLGEH